jgi:hypothetical protein
MMASRNSTFVVEDGREWARQLILEIRHDCDNGTVDPVARAPDAPQNVVGARYLVVFLEHCDPDPDQSFAESDSDLSAVAEPEDVATDARTTGCVPASRDVLGHRGTLCGSAQK